MALPGEGGRAGPRVSLAAGATSAPARYALTFPAPPGPSGVRGVPFVTLMSPSERRQREDGRGRTGESLARPGVAAPTVRGRNVTNLW